MKRIILSSLLIALTTAAWSQNVGSEAKPPIANVDRTILGVYRAMAQIAFEFHEKKDDTNAAKEARILMLVWSIQEDQLEPSLGSWRAIDHAMDAFAKPLVASDKIPLNDADVKAAYRAYLDQLVLADRPL